MDKMQSVVVVSSGSMRIPGAERGTTAGRSAVMDSKRGLPQQLHMGLAAVAQWFRYRWW
jgi:hypothetical protein